MVLAFLMGLIAGLRAMTAPTAVSWAAFFGLLNLEGTWLAFLGYRFTPWILTVLALGELITDQLPTTPSRKLLLPFATRIIMGGLCGGAVAAQSGSLLGGLVAVPMLRYSIQLIAAGAGFVAGSCIWRSCH